MKLNLSGKFNIFAQQKKNLGREADNIELSIIEF